MVYSKPARSCISSSIRLVDSSSFIACSSAFWLISCTFPNVRDKQLEHAAISDLAKIYQANLSIALIICRTRLRSSPGRCITWSASLISPPGVGNTVASPEVHALSKTDGCVVSAKDRCLTQRRLRQKAAGSSTCNLGGRSNGGLDLLIATSFEFRVLELGRR
jgi:hypothetical protein